jgi:hypothetical protein
LNRNWLSAPAPPKPLGSRNNRKFKGILIGPPMAPHFSVLKFPRRVFFAAQNTGWLRVKYPGADGKPTLVERDVLVMKNAL